MNPAWLAAFAAAIASAAWLAHSLSGLPLVGYDDANIFFVYARNLVQGHGFVYNPGGERVEGFTSLLWLLICGAARAITPRFEILLFAISAAAVSVALWRLHAFVGDLLQRSAVAAGRWRADAAAFALIAAIALAPGFVSWNVVSLMDSGLWSALFVIAAVSVLRSAFAAATDHQRLVLPALLIVLVITRPESLLIGPALIAVSVLIAVIKGAALRSAVKTHARAALAFGAAAAALMAWRISYFGYPLPNTYYAKTGDPLLTRIAAGVAYFFDFVLSNPVLPLAMVAGVVTAVVTYNRYRTRPDSEMRSWFAAQLGLLLLFAVSCAIPLIEGGDHFGFWRMFQPVAPLSAIQAALTLWALVTTQPAPLRTQAAAVFALAIALALVPWRHWPALDGIEYASAAAPGGVWNTPRVEIAIAADMRTIGEAFNRAFPDHQPRVGVIVAGGFALEYAGPTIDLMGLNNVAMAHSPGPRSGMRGHAAFHPDVFVSLNPDVLLLSLWSPERDWFGFPMMAGEYAQPAHTMPGYFQRRASSMQTFDAGVMKGVLLRSQLGKTYAWASVRPNGAARWIHAIFNREYLRTLEARGYEVIFATAVP